MDLHIIPFSEVRKTIQANHANGHTSNNGAFHNTHDHSLAEITAALPDVKHEPPASQPWILFDPYLDVVLQSQRIARTDVHTFILPNLFMDVVERIEGSSVPFQTINPSELEELEDLFPKRTEAGVATTSLFSEEEAATGKKYFARLSTCSMKDSAYRLQRTSKPVDIGSRPLSKIEQMWQRIATSQRAVQGIKDLRAVKAPVRLFLLPWDERIKPGNEYRVFCAPGGGVVTAVSQYRWHQPWVHFSEDRAEMERQARKVLDGVKEVHGLLIGHPEIESLKRTGFTFDVVEIDERICLMELNDFGAMNGCGSCLFHWIGDARVLYGKREMRGGKGGQVEFRVATAE